jgi:hypothetical protein
LEQKDIPELMIARKLDEFDFVKSSLFAGQ